MHILHVTPYYAPAYAFGGVVRAVEGMAAALVARGHTVTVLTTDALDSQTRYTGALDEQRGGVRVVRARNFSPMLRGRTNLSTPQGMKRAAVELIPQADVVHLHEFRTVENLLIAPLATQFGKPVVVSPHGTLALDTGRGRVKAAWDRMMSPALAARTGHVLCLTAHEREEAETLWRTFGSTTPTFSIIPNGVNPDDYAHLTGGSKFRRKYGLENAIICLFMARLHPRKGLRVLVEAFRRAAVPRARLVIAGPDEGALAEIMPLLNKRILVTGYLDGAERLGAFAAADVFTLPAVGEGLPMVVLEAMAAGLPVIVSPGCNLPEVMDYNAGVEVPPEVEPLADVLRALFTNPDARATMGAAARELVLSRFTWEGVGEQLEALYAGLAAGLASK